MKKLTALFVAVSILFAGHFASACDGDGSSCCPAKANAKHADATKQFYTCEMHPDVVSDKPGKCPKCGMTLIPKKDEPKKS